MMFLTSSSGFLDRVLLSPAGASRAFIFASNSPLTFSSLSRSSSNSFACCCTHSMRSSTARAMASRVWRSHSAHILVTSSSLRRTASIISCSRRAMRAATSASFLIIMARSSSSRRAMASRTCRCSVDSASAMIPRSETSSSSFCATAKAICASRSANADSLATRSRSFESRVVLCAFTVFSL